MFGHLSSNSITWCDSSLMLFASLKVLLFIDFIVRMRILKVCVIVIRIAFRDFSLRSTPHPSNLREVHTLTQLRCVRCMHVAQITNARCTFQQKKNKILFHHNCLSIHSCPLTHSFVLISAHFCMLVCFCSKIVFERIFGIFWYCKYYISFQLSCRSETLC